MQRRTFVDALFSGTFASTRSVILLRRVNLAPLRPHHVSIAAMSKQGVPTLDGLFHAAVTLLHAVDEEWPALVHLAALPKSARTTAPPEESVQTALDSLARVADAADRARLISANESLEEISTRSLKYLLLPYLQARAYAQVQGQTQERYAALQEAKAMLSKFFYRVDALRLLSERERDAALDETPAPAMSPSQRRDEKIARFRAEKDAEKRLIALRARARGEDDDEGEEAEREASLVVLQSAVRRGLDMLSSLEQEMEILKFAVRQLEKGVDPREKAERERPKGPPPGLGGLPPTFRIVNEREKEREKVFRPSHSLPTYTVEEWGQMEMERAIKAESEKKERDIVQAKRREEEDSDGEDAVERERLEKSRMDDWKDDHNKGSGNTIR